MGPTAAIYANNNKVKAPTDRSLYGEYQNTLNAQAGVAGQQYGLYNQYAPMYGQTNLGLTNQALFGTQSFDSNAYLSNLSPQDRQNVIDEAQRTGYTPQEWLQGHFQDQAAQGDTSAQQMLNNYSSRSGGLLDAYSQAVPQIVDTQNYANSMTRASNVADAGAYGGVIKQQLQDLNKGYYDSVNNYSDYANKGVGPYSSEGGLQEMFNTGPQYNQVQGAGPIRDVGTRYNARNVSTTTTDPALERSMWYASTANVSPLQTQLEQQANNELALGGQLSPDELRNIQQNSRAGFASRGLDATNASVVDETFNTDAAQRARLRDRQGFAASVDQQGFNQRQGLNEAALAASGAAQNYANLGLTAQRSNQSKDLALGQLSLSAQQANQGADISRSAQNQAASSANASNALNAYAQRSGLGQSIAGIEAQRQQQENQQKLAALQAQQSTYVDPYKYLMGMNADTGSANSLLGAGMNAAGASGSQTNSLFDVNNSYAQDLYNTNYNAKAATNIQNSNMKTSLTSAGMAGDAQVAAAAMSSGSKA